MIKKVGAWATNASILTPEKSVELALEAGLSRLDIMVNDHSSWRGPRAFTCRPVDRIAKFVRLAQDAKIECHITSWIMPHREYIEGAASKLVPMCNDLGIVSLQWDAEEPWTRATKAMRRGEAAKFIDESFADLNGKMGVNAIGYCHLGMLRPLVDICDYGVPQAYATSTSNVSPSSGVKRICQRWNDKFGKPIVAGLAAYRQTGIKDYSVGGAVSAALDAASEAGAQEATFWSLPALRRGDKVRQAVREWVSRNVR